MYFKQPAHELRGHSQKLMKQYSRTDIRKNYFSSRVVDIWNNLQDTTVVKDQSMASMKQKYTQLQKKPISHFSGQ